MYHFLQRNPLFYFLLNKNEKQKACNRAFSSSGADMGCII